MMVQQLRNAESGYFGVVSYGPGLWTCLGLKGIFSDPWEAAVYYDLYHN